MESIESKKLYELNEDYLNIYYSGAYQKYINKAHRRMSVSMIWSEFKTGYFLKRIISMFHVGKNHVNTYATTKSNERSTPVYDRIAVYTAVIGGYDTIKEPMYVNPLCDFYLVTDQKIELENSVWKVIDVNQYSECTELGNTSKARFVKTHPELLFPEYEYSIWVDGNIRVIADVLPLVEEMGAKVFASHLHPGNDCIYVEASDIIALQKAKKNDVNTQIAAYRKEGFPEHYGLFETNILIRKNNDDKCKLIDESWWKEMNKFTYRDQLSLTYVLWKNGIGIQDVHVIGKNPRMNPRFRYMKHN